MSSPVYLRHVGFALAFMAVTAGLVVGRTFERGRSAMLASDVAFDTGDVEAALAAAAEAALWYVPGGEHVRRAEARMRAIAAGAEAAGRTALAQRAWQALRHARREAGSPWSRRQNAREADDNAARLLASSAQRQGRDALAERIVLAYAPRPRAPLAAFGYGLGLLLLASACAFLVRDLRQRRERAFILGSCAGALGLLSWVLAALMA